MKSPINIKALFASIIVGSIITLTQIIFSGTIIDSPEIPFVSALIGFLITGIVVGLMSEGETIIEPGLASIVVGVISYFVLISVELNCFKELQGEVLTTNLILLFVNGVLLTFIGAWTGEKLQGTLDSEEPTSSDAPIIEWDWILVGTIVGITICIVIANLILISAGLKISYLIIAIVIGIFFAGFYVGFRSPGVTTKEGAMAGLFTAVLSFDIFKIAFDSTTKILTPWILIIGVVGGLIITYIGGLVGEKVQSIVESE